MPLVLPALFAWQRPLALSSDEMRPNISVPVVSLPAWVAHSKLEVLILTDFTIDLDAFFCEGRNARGPVRRESLG